jgi:hypothetical protein
MHVSFAVAVSCRPAFLPRSPVAFSLTPAYDAGECFGGTLTDSFARAGFGGSGATSSSIAFLKLLIPCPSPAIISGIFLPPNKTKTIKKMTISSCVPIIAKTPSSQDEYGMHAGLLRVPGVPKRTENQELMRQ